jgi:hypothetical protein
MKCNFNYWFYQRSDSSKSSAGDYLCSNEIGKERNSRLLHLDAAVALARCLDSSGVRRHPRGAVFACCERFLCCFAILYVHPVIQQVGPAES